MFRVKMNSNNFEDMRQVNCHTMGKVSGNSNIPEPWVSYICRKKQKAIQFPRREKSKFP